METWNIFHYMYISMGFTWSLSQVSARKVTCCIVVCVQIPQIYTFSFFTSYTALVLSLDNKNKSIEQTLGRRMFLSAGQSLVIPVLPVKPDLCALVQNTWFIMEGFSGATFLPFYCVFREGKDYVVMFKKLGKQLPFAKCLNGGHRMGSCFFLH